MMGVVTPRSLGAVARIGARFRDSPLDTMLRRLLASSFLVSALVSSPAAGALRLTHGDYHERVAVIAQRLREDPDDHELILIRARLHREHRAHAAALVDVRRAVHLGPGQTEPLLEYARLLIELGLPSRALAEVERARALAPGSPRPFLVRARAHEARGAIELAVGDYDRALELALEPNPEWYLARAQLLASLGEEEQALVGLDAALETHGPIPALTLFAARLDSSLGRVEAALARIDALAVRSSRQETWLFERGALLREAGRTTAARVAFEDCLQAVAALPAAKRSTQAMKELARRARSARAQLASPHSSAP